MERQFVPESPEEEGIAGVRSLSTTQKYRDSVATLTQAGFDAFVLHSAHLRSLWEVKELFLLGKNEFEELRHTHAFFNFYFVLEWLYGNGEFRKHLILREFERSAILTSALTTALNTFRRDGRHWPSILADMTWVKDPNAIGVVDLRRYLVEMRGRAHHVSRTKKVRAPLGN